ncbi:MAG: hypothetical protein P1U63_02170 [Coxiellaceae bacterium]|nr:hypothetical protein [Coxiellaceae bacterium]
MRYGKANALTDWFWLLLWAAVAFAVYSVVAYYSQPSHNDLLYNADALFVPTLFKYIFQQHYPWRAIHGSDMTFLVPDFFLYSVSRLLTSNAMQAMTGFAILQTALYAWTISLFKSLSERPKSPLFLLSALISLSLLCFGYLGNELLPTVVAGFHVGLLIVVLLSLWCCCSYILQPKVWYLVALTALVVVSVISDIIYFTSFIAPLFAVLFLSSCIGVIDQQRLKKLSLCLALAIILAMAVFYLFPMQFDRKFFNHRGVALIGPLLIFAAIYARQINKPLRWGKRGVYVIIVALLALLLAGLVLSAFQGTPFYVHSKSYVVSYLHAMGVFIRANSMIAVVYAMVMVCCLVSIIRVYRLPKIKRELLTLHQQIDFMLTYFAVISFAICFITSVFFDFDFGGVFSDQLRHFQAMLLFPLFVILPLMLSNSKSLYHYVANRWFVVLVVILVTTLVFWLTPSFNRANRLHYYMPLAKCLDGNKDQYHLRSGLVSYWQSKPINMFSQRGMRTVVIRRNPFPSTAADHAILTEYWLNALPPFRQLDFNYLVFGDDVVDANTVRHQFGQPQQQFVCGSHAVWVYADGQLNQKLQQIL